MTMLFALILEDEMFVWTFEGVMQAIIMGIIFIPLIGIFIIIGFVKLYEKILNILGIKGD